MRRLIAGALIMLLVAVCGCSADGGNSGGGAGNDQWEYGTGYVLEKADGRLLIVSEKFEAGQSANEEVLENGGMKAIWLAVKNDQFDMANIGDHVKITVVGAVAESYPEQGTGSIELVE